MLELLWSHIEGTCEFQCRVRWKPNTLVFWDNWCHPAPRGLGLLPLSPASASACRS